jgi:hypothetical protein
MKLSLEDQRLLEELCRQQGISPEKVLQLLAIEQEYEFKDRRTGIYDALREVLKSKPTTEIRGRNET